VLKLSLKTRVAVLESQVDNMSEDIKSISENMEASRKLLFGLLVTALAGTLGVVSAMITLVVSH
jgi:tetrahydromethanopterin S-methyltransferase subunit F